MLRNHPQVRQIQQQFKALNSNPFTLLTNSTIFLSLVPVVTEESK